MNSAAKTPQRLAHGNVNQKNERKKYAKRSYHNQCVVNGCLRQNRDFNQIYHWYVNVGFGFTFELFVFGVHIDLIGAAASHVHPRIGRNE